MAVKPLSDRVLVKRVEAEDVFAATEPRRDGVAHRAHPVVIVVHRPHVKLQHPLRHVNGYACGKELGNECRPKLVHGRITHKGHRPTAQRAEHTRERWRTTCCVARHEAMRIHHALAMGATAALDGTLGGGADPRVSR